MLQAKKLATARQASESQQEDYPNLAMTPTSFIRDNEVVTPSPAGRNLNMSDQKQLQKTLLYQKLAHAEIKIKRLLNQMQEMNLEYKC